MKKITSKTNAHQAGFSARAAYRSQRNRLSTMSWKRRLGGLAGIAAAGAVIGFAVGMNPMLTAAGAAVISIVAALMMMAPQTFAMVGMFAAYMASAMVIAPMFAFSAAPNPVTLSIGSVAVIGMWIAGAAAFWASIKFSRRTPWVTYLLALVGSVVFGGILVVLEPELGMFALYFSMAVILVWRSVVGEWVKGSITLGYYKVRGLVKKETAVSTESSINDVDNEWLRREQAERKTAKILSTIDNITVFHDRQVAKNDAAIPHIIVGPNGVIIAASIITDKKVTESKAFGIEVEDVPLGYVASNLIGIRDDVAKAVKLPRKDISLFIVVHSTIQDSVATINRKVGVFTSKDGAEPSETIRLVGSESLVAEIDLGFETVPKSVQKAIVARGRMKFRPARPASDGTFTQLDNAALGVIDADGKVIRPYAVESSSYSDLGPGVRVTVRTEEGDLLDDIIVAGRPYLNDSGHMVVDLALSEEYYAASRENRDVDTVPFRVDSISIDK